MSFRDSILILLEKEEYTEARQLLYERLNGSLHEDFAIYIDVAISLIDLGDESFDAEAIEKGLKMIEAEEEEIKRRVSLDSLNYCLGNAYSALHKIARRERPNEVPTLSETAKYLAIAKNYYWKSVKATDKDNQDFSKQVYVNLANCLSSAGRIVESIIWQGYANQIDSQLHQAIVGRLEAVLNAYRNAHIPATEYLFAYLIKGYKEIVGNATYPEFVRKNIKANLDWCLEHSQQLGINAFDLDQIDAHLNLSEFVRMTPERKFILINHLSLNEHSLYCTCNGALHDDLQILHKQLPVKETDHKLEKYFVRVCNEFQFARSLFFSGAIGNNYTEESFRTSFRLCFGVFDKIALGLCQLYSLDKGNNESIYFTTFWSSRKKRYEQLETVSNLLMTALYSIASDLNKIDGEFGFYKEYRNKLEHDLFLLGDEEGAVPMKVFQVNTLHLLQLCRAAIFSFAFCIRKEMLSSRIGQLS
jgi:hypothetical protein